MKLYLCNNSKSFFTWTHMYIRFWEMLCSISSFLHSSDVGDLILFCCANCQTIFVMKYLILDIIMKLKKMVKSRKEKPHKQCIYCKRLQYQKHHVWVIDFAFHYNKPKLPSSVHPFLKIRQVSTLFSLIFIRYQCIFSTNLEFQNV